jgi:hypothetical protein
MPIDRFTPSPYTAERRSLMKNSRIDVVRGIYESFGKQDVPAILERLAPDVQWEYGPTDARVPYLVPRKGAAEVGGFFQAIGEASSSRGSR